MEDSSFEEMPEPYLKALRQEVDETKRILSQTENQIRQRQIDAEKYYSPIETFISSVQKTREKLHTETQKTLDLIEQETRELEEIEAINRNAIHELQISSDVISDRPIPEDDHPIGLALRSIASLFPFVTFALLSFFHQSDI